jgi:2-polyprenyl-3-methyl-5-hydroxy-6-metoxy-1,4-benzoquinol methylase
MPDVDYTREYFSGYAKSWLGDAYGSNDPYPQKYPVGLNRVRLTLDILKERCGLADKRLLDLGCGGGDLCLAAAHMGMNAFGVDSAEGMIREAESKRAKHEEDVRSRSSFILGDALNVDIEGDEYDAVSALGLIEYLPDDKMLFKSAGQYLDRGGVLVISCRNRLFNLASLNEYTRKEIESGAVSDLLEEARQLTSNSIEDSALASFASIIEAGGSRLQAAQKLDAETSRNPANQTSRQDFGQERRQHTPRGLRRSAEDSGFKSLCFVAVHPHFVPPAVVAKSPRMFNEMNRMLEGLERSPAALVWSSAFIGAFRKS